MLRLQIASSRTVTGCTPVELRLTAPDAMPAACRSAGCMAPAHPGAPKPLLHGARLHPTGLLSPRHTHKLVIGARWMSAQQPGLQTMPQPHARALQARLEAQQPMEPSAGMAPLPAALTCYSSQQHTWKPAGCGASQQPQLPPGRAGCGPTPCAILLPRLPAPPGSGWSRRCCAGRSRSGRTAALHALQP